uniref:Very-long-chain (3R)-3-hydroxyacyl-CoA dehydratase n=1 Tax=Rhizophora mucronata TaxID=61149 RepID=A0A2P2K3W2_RHIMU
MKEAFGSTPSWLLWLRYSTFLLLYPTGISSEVGLIYLALPYLKVITSLGYNFIAKLIYFFFFFPRSLTVQLC